MADTYNSARILSPLVILASLLVGSRFCLICRNRRTEVVDGSTPKNHTFSAPLSLADSPNHGTAMVYGGERCDTELWSRYLHLHYTHAVYTHLLRYLLLFRDILLRLRR